MHGSLFLSNISFDVAKCFWEGCSIKQNKGKMYQVEAAQKQFEWLERSIPAAVSSNNQEADGIPGGIALPPHERDCGHAYPISGTNSDDLTEWCIRHET